jgi:hypothetical protein
MDGVTLLSEAQDAGLDLRADGERLVVRGPRRATSLVQSLLAEKHAMLGLLARDDPEVIWRAATMRGQLRPGAAPPVLVARPGPFPRGACISCGEPVVARTAGPAYRCAACAHAAWLVLAEAPRVTRES